MATSQLKFARVILSSICLEAVLHSHSQLLLPQLHKLAMLLSRKLAMLLSHKRQFRHEMGSEQTIA
jgi:hypothetical protein